MGVKDSRATDWQRACAHGHGISRRLWLRGSALTLLGTGAAGLLVACGKKAAQVRPIPAGATVLALGDSLTSGVGAAPAQAFPVLLAEATGWQVVNGGVSGDTSAQALARLPGLLAEYRPELVIVGIGGNDFLRRVSTQETQANIRRIVQHSLDVGAQVLLVGVPGLTLMATAGLLSDHALYDEVAKELRVPQLRGAWSSVLADERLRADQIHANAQGYALFTQKLVDGLRDTGLLH